MCTCFTVYLKKANGIHIRNIRTYPHAKLDPCMPTHLHTYIHTYCTFCATPSTGLDSQVTMSTDSEFYSSPVLFQAHLLEDDFVSVGAPRFLSCRQTEGIASLFIALKSECGKIISELGHWGSSQLGVEKPRPCWGNWGCYGICAYILITCCEVEFSYARSMSSWLVPLEVFASDCNLQFSVPCNLLQLAIFQFGPLVANPIEIIVSATIRLCHITQIQDQDPDWIKFPPFPPNQLVLRFCACLVSWEVWQVVCFAYGWVRLHGSEAVLTWV